MTRRFIWWQLQAAGAIAAVALSACSMIPRYQRPASPVPDQFPGAPVVAREPAASDVAWRVFINEKRLTELIELALLNNRDLRVAMLNVEQSRAQYRITRSASFPAVDAGASLLRERVLGLTTAQWSANVGTTAYELDFFGRVRSLNQQALEQYFATEAAQRNAHIALVAEVAIQYFMQREAEEQVKLAQHTLSAVQEAYRLNELSFEAGEANEQDLRAAEGEVQTAKLNVLSYQLQEAQSQNALTLLIGQSPPAQLPDPSPFDAANILAEIPAGLPSDLMQRRPDILQAEHTLKAANANIGAARAAFFPTISLTGSVGSSSSALSHLFGAGSGAWSFSPQITVPLFAGGGNQAALEAATIGAQIDVANYEKAVQTAFREVADALVAGSSYVNQIKEEALAIQAQQRRLELANLRYRSGQEPFLAVLLAQQDLYGAQQQLLQAQFNRFSSEVLFYKALGGGWQ